MSRAGGANGPVVGGQPAGGVATGAMLDLFAQHGRVTQGWEWGNSSRPFEGHELLDAGDHMNGEDRNRSPSFSTWTFYAYMVPYLLFAGLVIGLMSALPDPYRAAAIAIFVLASIIAASVLISYLTRRGS